MYGTLKTSDREYLTKALTGSFIAHVVVLTLALFMYRGEAKRLFFTPVYTVDLVEPGLVKAPAERAVIKEAPKAKAPEALKKEEPWKAEAPEKAPVKIKEPVRKEAPAPVLVKEDVSVKEALERIKARVERKEGESLVARRIEELKGKKEAESAEVARSIEAIRKTLADGSKRAEARASAPEKPATAGAPGASVTREALEVKYPAYYALIRERVQANWSVPEEFRGDGLSIIVAIRIRGNGELDLLRLEKSSGRTPFDESLLNAVRKSAPFPPLPEGFEGEFLETGLRFCPDCRE